MAQRAPLGAAEIIPSGALPPAFDLHCELMSLPMALGLRLEDLPGPMPFLQPGHARLARWRDRLVTLGHPAWVVLPHAPDWRWLTQRTDTPWYPAHRLFRQHRRHRWDEIVADLSAALKNL